MMNTNTSNNNSSGFFIILKQLSKIWVFSILLVFFIQSVRLIVAILIANYYEYVSTLVLILLGFSVIIGPILGIFTLNQELHLKVFAVSVSVLLLSRLVSVFISVPSIQFFLAVLIGVTALLSFSTLFRIVRFSREEMILGIVITPIIDLILKAVSYSSDLIYYFDIVQFLILLTFLALLGYFSLEIFGNTENIELKEKGTKNELLYGMSLIIGFILFLKLFSTPGTIIFFIHSSYSIALLLYSVFTLFVFIVSWYVSILIINNRSALYYVIASLLLFIITVSPLVFLMDLPNWLLLISYLMSYLFLLLTINFSTVEVNSARKFTVGITLGLFLSLLMIVIQLLVNLPVLTLIYAVVIALASLYNQYSQMEA